MAEASMWRKPTLRPLFLALMGVLIPAAGARAATPRESAPIPERIEFNRDLQPILGTDCFACPGPGSGTRKADLRLDTKAGLFAAVKGKSPVVPGHPEQS